ncbi:MAG: cobalamin-dependent protein, partial [Lachnospiraceae bacterium]|nr:cobalamin-dependent protein [Lachnospiraceae bacterium]
MKILLVAVNAKYIHCNLALYSLRAAAGRSCRDYIEIAEYTINQQMDEILRDLYKKQPDLVAFSCYIWNRRMIGELLKEIPKVLPDVILWAGGPEASYDAETLLETYPYLSGIMRGEGEGTFARLADYYIEGTGQLSRIRGITFRDAKKQMQKTEDPEMVDLDQLSFAYEDLEAFSHKILYYESSRGCPYRCSYCLSSIEKRVRFRSLSLVKQDLQRFLKARVPQVKFVDRTFNADVERAEELWEWILEHDNGVTNFHFEVGADRVTEKAFQIMRRMRPGLIQLEIGVQSVNPDT